MSHPMGVSDGFRAFVVDQLADLGDITARAMFGGVGLYCDGRFFGLLAGDVLYLKADEINRPSFEAAGGRAFKPYAHRPESMNYFSVPVGVLESSDELVKWARQAVAAAGRTADGALTTRTKTTKKTKRKPKQSS
jgi:DNA transformation protein and related proteins